MSSFEAIVSEIQKSESLHIVEFDFHTVALRMMSLELHEDLTLGTRVQLVVKPSHIALGKEFSGAVSYSNQLPCTILSIELGELLCSVTLVCFDTELESLITATSARRMRLQIGERVTAFIKASELAIGVIL